MTNIFLPNIENNYFNQNIMSHIVLVLIQHHVQGSVDVCHTLMSQCVDKMASHTSRLAELVALALSLME